MLIGIDFDNTLVCYDEVFRALAVCRGLAPADVTATKQGVRDHLRRSGQEDAWTALQGYVYGVAIHDAPPFPGALEFFTRCKEAGVQICVISHKTRYPVAGPRYDLHQGAQVWLERHGFYEFGRTGLRGEHVFFEPTRQRKLRRIAERTCSHFIDDMPECLLDVEFPAHVARILLDPGRCHHPRERLWMAASWAAIGELLLGKAAAL